MLVVMITLCRRNALPMLTLLTVVLATFAHARTNPYDAIVERNAFGLKPAPPPVAETNQTEATPPVKVVLTGITSIFGPTSPRAFFEIVEQAPPKGGTPVPPRRPILGVGDREGDVEVVSIDIGRNIVKIRNGIVESELTFEVPKPSGPTPTGHVAGAAPSPMPAAPAASQPIIISSSESRGGVTMAGGGGGFQGNTAGVTSFGGSTPVATGNSGGISSYGGVPPSAFGAPGTTLASASGYPTIPSRTIRTPTVPESNVDPETQALLMEANRIRNNQINQTPTRSTGGRVPLKMPPLPPTRLTGELYGGGAAGAQ
jgi:hypothetical protein